MTQPTQRPHWLKPGQAFCPGPKEKIVGRMHIDNPGFVTTYYTCEHGEWLSLAEAWSDHETLPELHLTSDPDQAAQASFGVRYDSPPAQLDSGS